jgi:hypothetical protein
MISLRRRFLLGAFATAIVNPVVKNARMAASKERLSGVVQIRREKV